MHNHNDTYINNQRIGFVYSDYLKLIVLHPIIILLVYGILNTAISGSAIQNSVLNALELKHLGAAITLPVLMHILLFTRFHNSPNEKASSWEVYCSIVMFTFGLYYGALLAVLGFNAGVSIVVLLSLIMLVILSVSALLTKASIWVFLSFSTPILLALSVVFVLTKSVYAYALLAILGTFFVLATFTVSKACKTLVENLLMQSNTRVLESKLAKAEAKLKGLITTDKATGLYSRQFFDRNYSMEFRRAKRSGSNFSVMIAEIDCFDEFKAHFGAEQTDKMHTKVATILKNRTSRASEMVAIFNESTFVFLLPNTKEGDAEQFAKIIQTTVLNACIPHITAKIPGLEHVSMSVGIAQYPTAEALTAEETLKVALSTKKQARLSGATFYDKPQNFFTFK